MHDLVHGLPSSLPSAAEVHQLAEEALKQQAARVPRGCLLRRVSMTPGDSFAAALERAGYRGDRLSVWALQVISVFSSFRVPKGV